MKQTRRFLLTVILLVAAAGIYIFRTGGRMTYLTYNENLDKAVAVVDGDELLLRDLAFYIAYEEGLVEEHAVIYNDKDTGAFWRIFTNHTFFRSVAKENVMQMALHDTIFYELSREAGIVLNEEEQQAVTDAQTDFWSDLEEEQKEALGVAQEELDETVRRIALAEKYQTMLAAADEKEYEEYSFAGEEYLKLLDKHEYEIYEDVWEKIRIGSITVDH